MVVVPVVVDKLVDMVPAGVNGASSILPFLIGGRDNVHVVPESNPFMW